MSGLMFTLTPGRRWPSAFSRLTRCFLSADAGAGKMVRHYSHFKTCERFHSRLCVRVRECDVCGYSTNQRRRGWRIAPAWTLTRSSIWLLIREIKHRFSRKWGLGCLEACWVWDISCVPNEPRERQSTHLERHLEDACGTTVFYRSECFITLFTDRWRNTPVNTHIHTYIHRFV